MQRLLIFLGFMAFGTWLIYAFAVPGEQQQSEAELFQGRPNLMVMDGVRHQETKNGQLSVDLRARRAQLDEKSMDSRLEDVRFTLYEPQPGGQPTVRLTGRAAMALMNRATETLELSGGVRLTDGEGRRMTSQRFLYNGKTQRLRSPGPVRITSEDGVQEGTSMEYQVKQKKMTLTRPRFYQ